MKYNLTEMIDNCLKQKEKNMYYRLWQYRVAQNQDYKISEMIEHATTYDVAS